MTWGLQYQMWITSACSFLYDAIRRHSKILKPITSKCSSTKKRENKCYECHKQYLLVFISNNKTCSTWMTRGCLQSLYICHSDILYVFGSVNINLIINTNLQIFTGKMHKSQIGQIHPHIASRIVYIYWQGIEMLL